MRTADEVIQRPLPQAPPRPPRASFPTRWGTWVARHRWHVLVGWGVLVVVAALAYPHLDSSLSASDYSATGSDSAKVAHTLATDFTAAGGEQDVVVFDSDTSTIKDAAYQQTVNKVNAALKNEKDVVAVLGPTDPGAQGQVSADGRAALTSLGLSGNDRERGALAEHLQHVVSTTAGSGAVKAYLTGYSPTANDLTAVETSDTERAESIGIPIALIVLLFALAAVVAGLIPLGAALVALMATYGVLSLLITFTPFDAFLLSIVTMIGVGISIDYSLFITTRFREELAKGHREGRDDAVTNAVGVAMATSGRTVLFSGTIVAISLFSLYVVSSPIFHGMAWGAVLVVVCTLFTAWTMLPALLAALGDHVNTWQLPKRFRPAEESAEDQRARPSGWARWAHTVLRHPWLAIPALALLVLFALPTFGIKLGIDLGISSISNTPSGKGEIVLANSFSPGVLSPIQILATHQGSGSLSANDLTTIDNLTTSLAKDPRVAAAYSISTALKETGGQLTPQALTTFAQDPSTKTVAAQMVNTANGSNRTVITVISKDAIDSTNATNLVNGLRTDTIPAYTAKAGPEMLVGGATAQFSDLADETWSKLPVVMAMVLSLSFLYLLIVFRSVLIPVKAVLMNLLATGAAFGLTTWVFQGDHLSGVFNFTSVGYVQVYLPIFVFALLFGLSMDYEVFLMSRMREEWDRTHDNDEAVAAGIAHTGRAITAAALIMAAVFGCFLVADVLELKEFGWALAVAVVLDATLVRLLLVPAIMKVMGGKANWWLPRWLDRILPKVHLD